jgi:DHA3 family tetracycline resistance protein-like MFS transporter
VLSQAAYSIAIILSEVPTGIIGDKFGHRKSVILGCLCEVFGIGFILLFPNVVGLFGGYILLGIGQSFQSGSTEALLYEGTTAAGKKREYKRHLSQILSNDTLAFAVGTGIVGIMYGWRGTSVLQILILCSLISKFLGFLTTLKLKDIENNKPKAVSDSNMWQTFRQSLNVIKRDGTLRNLTYIKLLTLTAQYVILSVYQSYFINNHVPALYVGLVLTAGALANAVCMRNIYRLEKYFSLDKIVLWLNLLMGSTYLVLSFARAPWLLIVVFVLLYAQYNLQDPIISDYINDRTETGIRATVLSGISLIRAIGNTISKILLGLAVAGVSIGGMLRIQAGYLVVGSLVSYWLLIRCGCVYKLSDEPTEEARTLVLEAEVEQELRNT